MNLTLVPWSLPNFILELLTVEWGTECLLRSLPSKKGLVDHNYTVPCHHAITVTNVLRMRFGPCIITIVCCSVKNIQMLLIARGKSTRRP